MLDTAINDFRFTLNKAIEGLVSSENQVRAIEDSGLDVDLLKKSQMYKAVVDQLVDVYDKASTKRQSVVSSNAINLKITDVTQFKNYSVRMLKALREDLAKIQNNFVS